MKLTMLLLIATISMASSACSNLLDTELKVLDSSKKMNMCEYEGSVILVVNVASKCGYTYQYETLQGLYDKYKDDGLVVVGIPSRDFRQEYSEEASVAEFCSTECPLPNLAISKIVDFQARSDQCTPLLKHAHAHTHTRARRASIHTTLTCNLGVRPTTLT